MRLLLAEDEKSLSRAIVTILQRNNYSVDAVYNGKELLEYLTSNIYDGVILDVMMPEMDGITALRELRASGNRIPVLILSAKSEVDDKVLGLDSGANDYLTKPFSVAELLARIRAMTRSGAEQMDSRLSFGNLTLDCAGYSMSTPDGKLQLANKEFQILELLMRQPGQVLSAEQLMEKVWGFDSDSEINVVWTYISYLRKKLSALHADVEIRAKRNAGYLMVKS